MIESISKEVYHGIKLQISTDANVNGYYVKYRIRAFPDTPIKTFIVKFLIISIALVINYNKMRL